MLARRAYPAIPHTCLFQQEDTGRGLKLPKDNAIDLLQVSCQSAVEVLDYETFGCQRTWVIETVDTHKKYAMIDEHLLASVRQI